MNINRKFERRIVYILGVWQIMDGLITILFYGIYQQNNLITNSGIPSEQIYASEDILSSMFIFITVFGLLLIGFGLINLVIAKNYIKDTIINNKIGIWLLILGVTSYFIMDILSVVLSISAGVIYLAKNKSIKTLNN